MHAHGGWRWLHGRLRDRSAVELRSVRVLHCVLTMSNHVMESEDGVWSLADLTRVVIADARRLARAEFQLARADLVVAMRLAAVTLAVWAAGSALMIIALAMSIASLVLFSGAALATALLSAAATIGLCVAVAILLWLRQLHNVQATHGLQPPAADTRGTKEGLDA